MNLKHIGDSYDMVKFYWSHLLRNWAPLYADLNYIPFDLQHQYSRVTSIPVLGSPPNSEYSILVDPDIGIRHPKSKLKVKEPTHTTLDILHEHLKKPFVRCVIAFDQSFDRRFDAKSVRESKMEYISSLGVCSFYYTSQCSFLFCFRELKTMNRLMKKLVNDKRLEARIESLN